MAGNVPMTQVQGSVTLYSTKAWSDDFRTIFSLPFSPYYESDDAKNASLCLAAERARALLKEFGVVYYRDEFNANNGIIIPSPDVPAMKDMTEYDSVNFPLEEPLTLYRYVGICKYPKVEICIMPRNNARSKRPGKQAAVYKDLARWLIWKQPVQVVSISPTIVRTI